MLLPVEQHVIGNTIEPMISSGTATRIDSACFIDGDDDEYVIEFFRLWGETIRSCYNRRSTCYEYHFVKGEARERLNRYSDLNYQI